MKPDDLSMQTDIKSSKIKKMRSVCFVKHLEFELEGNVLSHAIGLGDIDNDGNNELIIGNINGDLTIFKEDREWQKISGLGMITAIGVGDVFNIGCNALVVVCGDGWCHILLKSTREIKDQQESKLESVHVQRIPANTKVVLLGDMDGDGGQELVLGLTDRVVRCYRWLAEQAEGPGDRPVCGRLVGLHKWECANQIGTVTLNYSADGRPCLLVAQPGGTFLKIRCNVASAENTDDLASTSVDYHPLTSSRMRNPNVSTGVLGCIRPPGVKEDDKTCMRYAVATLDGTLMLVQNEEVLWSIQVDHQLFALDKLDVTGDGAEEIVACSWDGQTYILDQRKCCVRFQLEESVRAFCCGRYTLGSSRAPTPVFIYNTFTNKVYVFHDISLARMVVTNHQSVVQSVAPQLNRRNSQLLMEWCLYGRKR
ncbi:KICSTOR complex protein ITFG2-like [Bacillus rossius redtenbacheri]|uniref:KICSTOR complex protein ITFG2-like n=1 Tax=Bacillus rossius redtenbacheri TaxID=93214 RepID=UPI002FDE994D